MANRQSGAILWNLQCSRRPAGDVERMARAESDREDLLREAVALVRRAELIGPDEPDLPVIGFRETGWLSIYFGQDLMYQFDEVGRLRRAFVDGLLYRTHGRVLAQLRRERSDTETALVRRDLDEESLREFRDRLHTRVRRLRELLQDGKLNILRQVPPDDPSFVGDVLTALRLVLETPEFLAPAIKR